MNLFYRVFMKKLPILLIVSFLLVSCGNRIPSPKTSHRVLQRYFQKYGKKYKQSDFGRSPIERIEIEEVREMQKDMAEAVASVHLSGGSTYRVRVTLEKKTYGWKAVAWENLGIPEK